MLHALYLFDCCVKQNRRGSFRDKLRQPVQTDDDVSLACFSCLSALPTERPSILTPGHSAHHWPGVRQMVQCLLRSALRAWSLGLRSWELGANPLRMLSGWQWHDALMCPLGSKERDEGKPSRFASPWSTLAIRRGGLLRYLGSWAVATGPRPRPQISPVLHSQSDTIW